jgi:hypothetical protein
MMVRVLQRRRKRIKQVSSIVRSLDTILKTVIRLSVTFVSLSIMLPQLVTC